MASGPPADREQQIDQPYHIELVKSDAPGAGWSAKVEELPGCTAEGATPEEAATRVQDAMRAWIEDAVAHGRDIPKPRSAASHSGRLLVRMPQSLHAELARAAEREEVSLNQFITGTLASAVHWRGAGAGEYSPGATDELPPSRTRMSTALMANVLLLIVIALLVVAISRG